MTREGKIIQNSFGRYEFVSENYSYGTFKTIEEAKIKVTEIGHIIKEDKNDTSNSL